jgi:excisionase family DNA binding protein
MPPPTRQAEPTPLLLNIRDAAATLGVGKDFIYALVDAGTLPFVQLGTPKKSMRRISTQALQDYIDTHTEQANPQ